MDPTDYHKAKSIQRKVDSEDGDRTLVNDLITWFRNRPDTEKNHIISELLHHSGVDLPDYLPNRIRWKRFKNWTRVAMAYNVAISTGYKWRIAHKAHWHEKDGEIELDHEYFKNLAAKARKWHKHNND